MKVIDKRVKVETDDLLMRTPNYDTTSAGTTMAKFRKLPTGAPAFQIAIRRELSEQRKCEECEGYSV
jgi:hypothetical protein